MESKYSIFRRTNTFALFEQIVEDYKDKTILDFGGNRGNLIATSNGTILPQNYTCMDISRRALELCEKENPGVNTIFWNRYDKTYNPNGDPKELFPLFMNTYDIAFANSVFTHHTIEETLFNIRQLYTVTNRIVFTYIDSDNEKFFKQFNEKYDPIDWDESKGKKISYIVHKDMLWTVINTNYLKKRIRGDTHLPLKINTGKTTWFNYMDITVLDPLVFPQLGLITA